MKKFMKYNTCMLKINELGNESLFSINVDTGESEYILKQ